MVLIVNVFIAPNGSEIVNTSYHENFRDINIVNELDWCSFSLECLMTAIKKHLNNKLQGILEELQGCKILLVVRFLYFFMLLRKFVVSFLSLLCVSACILLAYSCALNSKMFYNYICYVNLQISYFEFLITSEFNLGPMTPRLPLWTTHVINSFIALDSQTGQTKQFGRLSVSLKNDYVMTIFSNY
jgi:hypothetical protein